MELNSTAAGAEPNAEAAATVRKLHPTEHRLQELKNGEKDAVVHSLGQSYLSDEALEKLRQSKAAPRDSAATQSSILNALPAHVALIDNAGVIISVNDCWRHFAGSNVLGGSACGLGQNYLEICRQAQGSFAGEAHEAAAGICAVLSGSAREFSHEYPFHSPMGQRWFRLTVSPMEKKDGPGGAVVTHVDITDWKLAEEAVREREERFRGTFEQAAVGIAHVSTEGRFVRVNDKLCDIAGFGREELLGMTFADLTVPEDRALGEEARAAMLAGVLSSFTTEKRYRRKGGEVIWANLVTTLQSTATGEPKYFISVFEDITLRKLAEFRLHRLNRLHTVLSKISEAMVRTRDRQQLYDTVCRIVVEDGLLRMAFVVEVDAESGRVRLVASCGAGLDYLREFTITTEGGALSRGTVGTVLRTGVHDFCNDIAGDPRMEPWRESALQNGFRASASFPLEMGGATIGALVLYAAEAGYFQGDEIRLMVAVAGDLSFALEAHRKEKQRERAESALRASEQQFSSAFEYSAIGVALVAPGGRFLKVNRSLCQMLGYPEEDLLALTFQDITHPEDLEADLGNLRQLLAGSIESYQMEKRYFHRRGHLVMVFLSVSLVRDDAGQPIHFVSQIQDITEQQRAREALRLSEERFRLLAEATNDAIWDWNVAANTVWWNEGFEVLFGFRRNEVEPDLESWTKRIHPDDRARVREHLRDTVSQGRATFADEYRFLRKDRSYAYVLGRGQIIRNETGQPIRMIGGMTDLTHRMHAEQRIAEQAALIDKAQDAIIVLDLEHRITYWNKSAERLYGWSPGEVMHRSVRELFYPEPAVFDEAMLRVLEQGDWVGELSMEGKDAREITVESRWTLVSDEAGQPRSVLVINTDITKRKTLEQQFLRAQRMESIGTLAGGIAHDLNNVLGPIMLSLDLLEMKFSDPDSRELIAILSSSARRGADMVKQVLSFARGVEGERTEVQVRHVIHDIEKIANETFLKHIHVRTIIPRDLWTVSGDPTQLHQVLLNLCVNARDAMPEGGTITLSAENIELDAHYAGLNPEAHCGSYVVLQMEDSGTGIAPEILEKIFDPFFTTKEVGKGTGLGLSTSLAIVKSHGGFFRVHSELGKGTTFKVYLPAQSETSPESAAEIAAEMPRGNGELILVVDDEPAVRQITQQTLEAFGYRVLLAADGAEAVAVYATRRVEIAVVLTDMTMPVMDGPATIRVLRKLDTAVRIIGASGLCANGNLAHAASFGVKHFLPKPYTAETLLKALNQILIDE